MGYPPFSVPGGVSREAPRIDAMPSIHDFLDDLPSIDDFIDARSSDLPPIDDFLETEPAYADEWRPGESQSADFDSDGWAIAGWQSFDWSGAAALGVRSQERSSAPDSWDTREWSASPLGRDSRVGRRGSPDMPPSADEVARALDGIARRIRSGELLIDQLSGTPPEAAMAAAIAAMLRRRD